MSLTVPIEDLSPAGAGPITVPLSELRPAQEPQGALTVPVADLQPAQEPAQDGRQPAQEPAGAAIPPQGYGSIAPEPKTLLGGIKNAVRQVGDLMTGGGISFQEQQRQKDLAERNAFAYNPGTDTIPSSEPMPAGEALSQAGEMALGMVPGYRMVKSAVDGGLQGLGDFLYKEPLTPVVDAAMLYGGAKGAAKLARRASIPKIGTPEPVIVSGPEPRPIPGEVPYAEAPRIVPREVPGKGAVPNQAEKGIVPAPTGASIQPGEATPGMESESVIPPGARPGGAPSELSPDYIYMHGGPTPPTSIISPERVTPKYEPFAGAGKVAEVLPAAEKPAIRQQLSEAYQGIKQKMGETFKFEYDLNRSGFAKLADDIRTQVLPARRRALKQAHDDLSGIVGGLANNDELLAFRDIIVLRDLAERGDKGLTLPRNLTASEARAALDWRMERVTPQVLEAVEKWTAKADALRQDLVARGKIGPDEGFNNYFPHQVLDYEVPGMSLSDVGAAVGEALRDVSKGPQGSGRGRIQYRGYVQEAKGSARDIDTNPLRPLFKHLVNVYAHNQLDDFVLAASKQYDKSAEVLPLIRSKYNRPKGWTPDPGERFEAGGRWYEAYQPDPGRQVYPATTISEKAINQIVSGQLPPGALPEATGTAPALGRQKPVAMLPVEVATRLNKLTGPQETGAFLRAANQATRAWKMLTIPLGGTAWNVMNLMGDMENLYRADPAAFKNIARVARDYWSATRGKAEPTDFIKLAEQMDVAGASWMTNEVGKFGALKEYQQFAGEAGKLWRPVSNLWDWYNTVLETREASTRLAHFYQNLERIKSGEAPRVELRFGKDSQGRFIVPKETAATLERLGLPQSEIDKVRWAAKNAREFTVDYSKFTDLENKVFRGMLAPFYAWSRQNTPNWFTYIARNPGEFSAKFLSFYAGAAVYNNTVYPEVEKNLPDYQRNRFHVILPWKDDLGRQAIVYMPGDPLKDALGVIGLDSLDSNIADVATGRMTLMEAGEKQLADLVKSPAQTAGNLLTPFIKAPLEAAANRSFLSGAPIYPEGVRSYPGMWAKEMGKHVAGSLVRPYREIGRAADQTRLAEMQGKSFKDVVTDPGFRYGLGLPVSKYDPVRGALGQTDEPRIDARVEWVTSQVEAMKQTPLYRQAPDAARKALVERTIREAERSFATMAPAPARQDERLMLKMTR